MHYETPIYASLLFGIALSPIYDSCLSFSLHIIITF
jgi:hypothetical protein